MIAARIVLDGVAERGENRLIAQRTEIERGEAPHQLVGITHEHARDLRHNSLVAPRGKIIEAMPSQAVIGVVKESESQFFRPLWRDFLQPVEGTAPDIRIRMISHFLQNGNGFIDRGGSQLIQEMTPINNPIAARRLPQCFHENLHPREPVVTDSTALGRPASRAQRPPNPDTDFDIQAPTKPTGAPHPEKGDVVLLF
jgi:hypothetical protein